MASSSSNPLPSCFGAAASISYEQLKEAVKNEENSVGEGVYHGILTNGKAVAIKVLYRQSPEAVVSKLSATLSGVLCHTNLVKLIGYGSNEEDEVCLIVYEFLPSLDAKLHGSTEEEEVLDWGTRVHIAVGMARGMVHLHSSEPPVVYGNFMPSKIVLDDEYQPKLLGFGFAEYERGTAPYSEPDYILDSDDLVLKCDVYSVGMVLLELISGRRAASPSPLSDWAKSELQNRRFANIADPSLGLNFDEGQLVRMVKLALECVHEDRNVRPSMTKVLQVLESVSRKEEEEEEVEDPTEDQFNDQQTGEDCCCNCCEGGADCCAGLNCWDCWGCWGGGGGGADGGGGAPSWTGI